MMASWATTQSVMRLLSMLKPSNMTYLLPRLLASNKNKSLNRHFTN